MNGSTIKVFASLKQVMTLGTYDLMLRRLRLCLLQGWVRSFERKGIHFTVEHRRLDRPAMHCLKTNSRAQCRLGVSLDLPSGPKAAVRCCADMILSICWTSSRNRTQNAPSAA
jgi:hypothetical protein